VKVVVVQSKSPFFFSFRWTGMKRHQKMSSSPPRGTVVIRPSRHSRFSSVGSMYRTTHGGVGLSHDEHNRAAREPQPKAPTFKQSNWLQDLWIVAGTALEDRELRQCEAIAAPKMLAHKGLNSPSKGTKSMQEKSNDRFSYQKHNAGSGSGKFYSADTTTNNNKKAALIIHPSKRFGADAFYNIASSQAASKHHSRVPLRQLAANRNRFEAFGSYLPSSSGGANNNNKQ
jgi:hypothetical protein